MRGFLIPVLILLIGGAAVTMLILWLRAHLASRDLIRHPDVRKALSAHGAARCVAATHALDELGRKGDSERIAAAWSLLEMPLLETLPDCPPDYKVPLINALDACARVCRVVDTSRAMVTMRNSLLN